MVFGKLFGKKSPEEKKASPLSSSITDSILSAVGSKSIPSMPASAQRAFELSTNPSSDARDFVSVIESDESMSARVIRVANSVYFDRGKPSKTIEEAVLVIGINEIRALLNANSLSEIFPSRHMMRAQLWTNDLATAVFARMLAERVMPGKTDVAFLGGLMHDVGKLLLLQRRQEDYPAIITTAGSRGDFISAEEDVFLFNHTHVGQLIGERWKFTPELLSVIRNHHAPFKEIQGSITALVKTADLLAHAIGLGHPRGFNTMQNQSRELLTEGLEAIGYDAPDLKNFLDQSSRLFSREQDRYQS